MDVDDRNCFKLVGIFVTVYDFIMLKRKIKGCRHRYRPNVSAMSKHLANLMLDKA